MSDEPKGHKAACDSGALPRDIDVLLKEIAKEPVPQRLLVLASELQAALAEKRRRECRSDTDVPVIATPSER